MSTYSPDDYPCVNTGRPSTTVGFNILIKLLKGEHVDLDQVTLYPASELRGFVMVCQDPARELAEAIEQADHNYDHWNKALKRANAAERLLLAVMEHVAPMLAKYEPEIQEHPVLTAIRDHIEGQS